MSDDKQKWEKPVVEPLGALARGSGLCDSGYSDADICDTGDVAVGRFCGAGGHVTGGCNVGGGYLG